MSAKPKTRMYLWGHPLLQAITPTHSPLRGLPFVSLLTSRDKDVFIGLQSHKQKDLSHFSLFTLHPSPDRTNTPPNRLRNPPIQPEVYQYIEETNSWLFRFFFLCYVPFPFYLLLYSFLCLTICAAKVQINFYICKFSLIRPLINL